MSSNPLVFLITTLANLYLLIVLLRLILQLIRADFYNPISQGVVKATNVFVMPLRRILPSIGRVDTASVVLALAVQFLTVFAFAFLTGQSASLILYIQYTVLGVIYHLFDLYFWAMIISIILSWVAPTANHPGALIVWQITEPLYSFFRRFIPSFGGLDISPIFIMMGIYLVQNMLKPYAI
ncbi:YggT family protein [Marinomonas agarivorans]|nr:YggT family protein [Marinomonas agarivorans]